MAHVDDLIEPRPEQILLAGLPPLPWPHLNPSARSAREKGITASDSRESQNTLQANCNRTAKNRKIRLLHCKHSPRPINGLGILHGRPIMPAAICAWPSVPPSWSGAMPCAPLQA